MLDFATKTDGVSTLSASEFNNYIECLENLILQSGITLNGSSTSQLGESVSNYVAVSSFYTCSGSANTYTATAIGSLKSPVALTNGMLIRFRPSANNTGASTINVAGLGAQDIKKADGTTDVTAGDLKTTDDVYLRYNGTDFILAQREDSNDLKGIELKTASYTLTDNDFNKCIIFNSSSAVNLNLQAISADNNNKRVSVKNINTGAVTIVPDGSNTTELTTINQNESYELFFDFANTRLRIEASDTQTSGTVLQTVYEEDGDVATGTTLIPADNTIPQQSSDGDVYLSKSITPSSATNYIEVEAIVNGANSAGGILAVALFKDAIEDSIGVCGEEVDPNEIHNLVIRKRFLAGTTSTINIKVHLGNSTAGTTTFNGESGTRLYGGVMASTLTLKEVTA